MKTTVLIAFLSFAFLTSYSQPADTPSVPKIGFGLDLGLPFTEGYGSLIGGLVRLEYPIKSDLSATASLGYSRLSYDKELRDLLEAFGESGSDGVVPIKVGLKKYLSSPLYLQGELGLAINDGTAFILSPRIGYEKPLEKGSIGASIRYELWTNDGSMHFVSLGLEYNLPLRGK